LSALFPREPARGMMAASEGPMGADDRPRPAPRDDAADRRWAWFALSLAALAVSVLGAFGQRTHGMLPPTLDRGALTFPRAVEGRSVGSVEELEFLAQTRAPGEALDVGAPPGSVTLVPEIDAPHVALTLASVLCFWAMCAFVLAPRTSRSSARALFACMACAGLGVGIGGVYPPQAPAEAALALAYVAAMAFLPAAFVRFTLAFPRRSALLDRHPRLGALPVLLALGAAAWSGAAWLAHFSAMETSTWEATRAPTLLIGALFVFGIAAGCVNLFLAHRRAVLARERSQAKWLFWGIAIGATPFVLLRMLPRTLFGVESEASIPPFVDRLVELAVPASFAIAIAKHKLFDIDVIIRRSLLYTALALVLATAFLPVWWLLGNLTDLPAALPREALWALAGAVPAALFLPARRVLGQWVDRTFFKIRHTHGQALRALDAPLAQAADQAGVAAALRRFLDDSLQPKACAVVVGNGAHAAVDGSLDERTARRAPELLAPLVPERGALVARSEATALPEVETPALAPELLAAGVHVVQPVAKEGRLLALLLLGEKASERRYVEEDLQLLAAAASRAALALERLALVQSVAEESLARRALADLDRQKTDFLLRVSHDLRTPLTAVRWSVDNLLDGLSGALSERQAAALSDVKAAAGQLGRLVDNLLAISRIEMGAAPRAPEPVDLEAVARDALLALRPQAEAKSVRLVLTPAPDLPPVRGRKDALYQVALNLVDNAVKYSPPGTSVEVSVGMESADVQALVVRDHGPGLPPGAADGLFDLFRQGRASPHSTAQGFGVGLYIVRSVAETLDGTVSAGNHPEGGAVFACRMKRWADTGGTP
jgi:signal transduction histidine kinase